MSGRVRVELADGRVVTGYRKTLRINRRHTPLERAEARNHVRARKVITGWAARLGFYLPKDLRAFVTTGEHGIGIRVQGGFVQISHNSADQCYQRARHFLGEIAIDRGPYTIPASVIYPDKLPPEDKFGVHLLWGRDGLWVTGRAQPRLYT